MCSKFAEIHFCISLKTKIGLMIDGITIRYQIKDFEAWKEAVNPSLFLSVGSDTGEVRTKKRINTTTITHRGKFETYDIIVKEVTNEATGKKSFYLTIKGSIHKNHYQGSNYLPFTWQDLQEQINHLCKNLWINPNEAQIHTLEVGLNICTPFEVTPFLNRNIISYKGNSFNRYTPDRKGVCLGIFCQLSQYAVKIYDKGLQFNLPENLMRFELRYLKMQFLNSKGIKYLSDLQKIAKIDNLKEILFKAWNEVLIFDISGTIKNLPIKQSEIDLLTNGKNPKFWEGLKETISGDQYKYQTKKFKKLVAKIGENWQTIVTNLLKSEWQNLFKNYPNLPCGKTAFLPEFTIKIKGKNWEKERKNGEKEITLEKRYCLSCGNELNPAQILNSKYCSAKYVGYERAHQCRNNNSNPRNNLKKKVRTITGRGLLFDIMPFFVNSNQKESYEFEHAI